MIFLALILYLAVGYLIVGWIICTDDSLPDIDGDLFCIACGIFLLSWPVIFLVLAILGIVDAVKRLV